MQKKNPEDFAKKRELATKCDFPPPPLYNVPFLPNKSVHSFGKREGGGGNVFSAFLCVRRWRARTGRKRRRREQRQLAFPTTERKERERNGMGWDGMGVAVRRGEPSKRKTTKFWSAKKSTYGKLRVVCVFGWADWVLASHGDVHPLSFSFFLSSLSSLSNHRKFGYGGIHCRRQMRSVQPIYPIFSGPHLNPPRRKLLCARAGGG